MYGLVFLFQHYSETEINFGKIVQMKEHSHAWWRTYMIKTYSQIPHSVSGSQGNAIQRKYIFKAKYSNLVFLFLFLI